MRLLKRRHYFKKENRLLVRSMNKDRNSTRFVKLTSWWEDSQFSPIEMYGREPLIYSHRTAKPMSGI